MSIHVLLVDDSALMRQTLGALLQQAAGITLQATAADPLQAMQRMALRWPDVIVLDVEMPHMDGLTFLRQLMAQRPTPVVICSTLTAQGAPTSVEALACGAFAVLEKPRLGLRHYLAEHAASFIATIRAAAQANVHRLAPPPRTASPPLTASALRAPTAPLLRTTEQVVALGTSTGGTQALEHILTALPRWSPGLVIVQHMPAHFTAAFAQRLDRLCEVDVREAQHGDRVRPGTALIAPGGRHLLLRRQGAHYHVDVVDGPLVSRHRPSVNVLFRSVARAAGANALGILMTGMGDDGAAGLGEMRQAGAHTVAQDETSSVVFGMPKEAIQRGAAAQVLGLEAMAACIVHHGLSQAGEGHRYEPNAK